MSIKKVVSLCLTMPLRDYSSFEDLVNELGVEITNVKILDDNISYDKQYKTRKRHIKGRITLTTEIWDAVNNCPSTMNAPDVLRELRKTFGNPPSTTLISRIRNGDRKRPEEKV